MDSDIIKLALLAIRFKFITIISAKYSSLLYNKHTVFEYINFNIVSMHKNYYHVMHIYFKIISLYPRQFKTCIRIVNFN